MLKRAQPTTLPQPAERFRSRGIKARLSVVSTHALFSLTAYKTAKGANPPVLHLRTPTRRQRRSVARFARLRRSVSKGQKKRLRLGRIQRKVKPTGYPALPPVTKQVATIT